MKVSYDNKVYLDELKDIPNKNKVTAEDMNEIKNAINSNSEEISKSTDEYSSSKTYSTGDLVIYNNKLYKASQDITTAEAFNSSHWTEVTLLSDVNEIKDVIDAKANSSDVYTKAELNSRLLPITIVKDVYVGDGKTVTLQIEPRIPYIFVNSHFYLREIVLITPYNGEIHIDRILSSDPNRKTSFTLKNNNLTIVGAANCRGYLYKLNYQITV